jgi:ABC-type nitrate/sulfonate/bicarbonate transport system permease component
MRVLGYSGKQDGIRRRYDGRISYFIEYRQEMMRTRMVMVVVVVVMFLGVLWQRGVRMVQGREG